MLVTALRITSAAALGVLTTALACSDDASSQAGGGGATSTGTESTGGPSSSASETATSSVSGSSSASSGGGGAAPDACASAEPVCPPAPPAASGQGIVSLDRCAFALDRAASFTSFGPLIDGLETLAPSVTLETVLGDLNRDPVVVSGAAVPGDPPGVELAFRWEAEENDKPTWVPQGITGSADADPSGLVAGRRIVVVSFYWKADEAPADPHKGVRLAFVDITNPAAPSYRFVLLVEPTAGPNCQPVEIHAGGIAWVGNYLYVAHTGKGLRVFDTTRILQADTAVDEIGCAGGICRAGLYKYVLPQVGAYDRFAACDPPPIFSFVALDRSGAVPRLVTGEHCSTTACDTALSGRVLRFPLDAATGALASPDRTYADSAFYMGERQVQGAVSVGDTFLLSSSEPAGGAGALYRVVTGGRDTLGWIDTPEDVYVDHANGQLFSLSEGLGERFVFGASLAGFVR